MSEQVTTDHAELAACPFCGGAASIERFGNTRVSTQYLCDDCGCFLETGEEFHHGRAWNRRPREDALLAEIAALRGERDGYCPDGAELPTWPEVAGYWKDRATQAERQRDEAVGLLRDAVDPYEYISDARAFEVMENGPATRLVAIRNFLASMEPKT